MPMVKILISKEKAEIIHGKRELCDPPDPPPPHTKKNYYYIKIGVFKEVNGKKVKLKSLKGYIKNMNISFFKHYDITIFRESNS